MNIWDVLILCALAALVGWTVRRSLRARRAGCTGCCAGCTCSCPHRGGEA